MTSRRVLKVASAIREVVSMAILTQIRDPRVSNVTVTFVEVTGDLREAKVHVSVMGDEKQQQLCMHGLQSSAGFLQKKVANRIDTRYTPKLKFVLDEGVKKSAEVTRILGQLLPEEKKESASSPRPQEDAQEDEQDVAQSEPDSQDDLTEVEIDE